MSEPIFSAADVQTLVGGMSLLGEHEQQARAALVEAVEAYEDGYDPAAIARELQVRFGAGASNAFVAHWAQEEASYEPEPEPPTAVEFVMGRLAETQARQNAQRLEAELAAQQAAHEAAEVARAGVPTVMLFVQSLRGLSHTKLEDTKPEHIELAVQALDRLATKTLAWAAG